VRDQVSHPYTHVPTLTNKGNTNNAVLFSRFI
jgi:hypothetical protein